MKNLNNTEGIDFVITWVDGGDPGSRKREGRLKRAG